MLRRVQKVFKRPTCKPAFHTCVNNDFNIDAAIQGVAGPVFGPILKKCHLPSASSSQSRHGVVPAGQQP